MKHISLPKYFGLIILLAIAKIATAQENTLTLEQAVRIALEKNYDIKLFANDLAISRNNVNIGNAGMLPFISGNFNDNNNIQNSRQTQSTGEIRELNNARNTNYGYGVNLSWTIFNGLQMFARYDQLKELQKLGEANLQLAVLTTVSNVIRIYYDLVQQQQQLDATKTALELSNMRLSVAKTQFEVGQAAKLAVLNAQVDLNTDTTNLLRQQEQYRNTQVRLNEVMARDISIKFSVSDTIIIDKDLLLAQLSELAKKQNPSLQAVTINKRIAELNLKVVKGARYPTIAVNSGYNFTESRTPLGFAVSNTGKGFNYGLTASVNLFNGFVQNRNERNAAIEINSAQLEYEKTTQNIESLLLQAYQTYQTSLALVALENDNQKIAQQNMDITLDKFKYGSITPLEFREAQINYINATLRFTNAQYQAKIAELALKEIAGNLL